MKNLVLVALLFTSFSGFAQCNLDLSLTASKTEYLDSTDVVQRTVDENTTIEITKTQVLISPGTHSTMTGNIKSVTCNWTTAYKEGKSVIKMEFEDPSGNLSNATLTIEGKGGQVTFTMTMAAMPNMKIRVALDSFKEKK